MSAISTVTGAGLGRLQRRLAKQQGNENEQAGFDFHA
jgi:hypothetical protein